MVRQLELETRPDAVVLSGTAVARSGRDRAASEMFRLKEGVEVTDSGLQYKFLQMGDGPKPAETDRVTVHYRGTLLNGEEFDSSYSRNQPATFQLNQVIPGWTEGVPPGWLLAAAQVVTAAQSIASRNADPVEQLVVSVTSFETSSTAFNVIPQRVMLKGTVRTLSDAMRDLAEARYRSAFDRVTDGDRIMRSGLALLGLRRRRRS